MAVADVHCAICPFVGVPELETLPPPAGVTHVPSPRQNVVADADVPLLRLVTGRLPVTPPLADDARLAAVILAPGIVPLHVTLDAEIVNPVVAEPPARAPTVVIDDVTTLAASVVPVSVPAGAMTADDAAAVIRPLPLTVKLGIAVDEPNDPTLALTVANVVTKLFAGVVISPV
jgi:hypothetical protein